MRELRLYAMKYFVRSFLCVLLSVFIVFVLSRVLIKKDNIIKYKKFYEHASEYDVLFFGPSTTDNGILPMELWNEYGITSYNMGNPGERLSMTYYTMLNSLDYSSPKVVVLDLSGMCWAGTRRDGGAIDHTFIDTVPLSKHKIEEITNLMNRDEYLEYIFPFYAYHHRWNELTLDDFILSKSYTYGASLSNEIHENAGPSVNEAVLSIDPKTEEANLDRIVKFCKDRKIQLVFTYLPSGTNWDQSLRDYCDEYALINEVPMYDMMWMGIVDFKTDFYDGSHLNVSGAKKVTHFIGGELKKRFAVEDRRHDEHVDSLRWNNDYGEFLKMCE